MKANPHHLLLLSLGISSVSLASTTFNATDKYAWGANTGWISFVHDQPSAPEGVILNEYFLSGFAYSANTGWINFGDGTPSNGYSYSNLINDHGVNHDGAGNLSGYAWSANTGWINFGWTTTSDPNRPQINLTTGLLSGYAWSANIGWINLGTGILRTDTIGTLDTDSYGIADPWEFAHFGNLSTADSTTDADHDGALDAAEYIAGSDPLDSASFLALTVQHYDLALNKITLSLTTAPSRFYRIEHSADIALTDPWATSSLGTFSPDSGSITVKSLTVPGSSPNKYFFRATAIKPLQP